MAKVEASDRPSGMDKNVFACAFSNCLKTSVVLCKKNKNKNLTDQPTLPPDKHSRATKQFLFFLAYSNYVSNLQYSPSSGTVIHAVIFLLCIQTITIMMQLIISNQPAMKNCTQCKNSQDKHKCGKDTCQGTVTESGTRHNEE